MRPSRHLTSIFIGATLIGIFSARAIAQTNQQLTLKPWSEGWFGETNDRILYQSQSHLKDEHAARLSSPKSNAQVFWWDSTGRFRFDKTDPEAPSIAYRWLTMNFDTNSRQLPDHLDEISLAAGFHLAKVEGGDLA